MQLERRHAEWIASFADRLESERATTSHTTWPSKVLPEIDNARSALDLLLASDSSDDAVLAGRIVGGLRYLWTRLGRSAECRYWVEAALNRVNLERHPLTVALLLKALLQASSGAKMFGWAQRAFPLLEAPGSGLAPLNCLLAHELKRQGRLHEADG